MTLQFLIGFAVIFICIVAQAALMATGFAWLRRSIDVGGQMSLLQASVRIGWMTMWLMLLHAMSIMAWALTFYALGALGDFDTAVYFAAVSYTTLGFGDIIPSAEWRHLAGLCAAHGLLVFGISSAALVEAFRQMYRAGVE